MTNFIICALKTQSGYSLSCPYLNIQAVGKDFEEAMSDFMEDFTYHKKNYTNPEFMTIDKKASTLKDIYRSL